MRMLAMGCIVSCIALWAAPLEATAQITPTHQAQVPESNPNSQYYNTRYLPSLGTSKEHYPWVDRFGSFAMSRSTGWSGWSQDLDSEAEADSAAIDQCKERGGGIGDCEVVVSFQNQCVAVARSERHTSFARADTLARSRSEAMRRCEESGTGCEIFREGCTMPELRK